MQYAMRNTQYARRNGRRNILRNAYCILHQTGFTAIEVLVSTMLLTVGLLAVAQSFPLGLRANRAAEYRTLAVEAAQAKLEEVLGTSYDELAAGTVESDAPVESDGATLRSNLRRTTTVTLMDGSLALSGSDLGLKQITVTLSWPAPFGIGQRSVSLSTLLAKR